MKPLECYLCGRQATTAVFVVVGDRYRCKSGDACQRRIRELQRRALLQPGSPLGSFTKPCTLCGSYWCDGMNCGR